MSRGSISTLGLVTALTVALTAAVWRPLTIHAANEKGEAHSGHQTVHMTHISTQAEAEALMPGDALAIACSVCKHVTVHHVSEEHSPIHLLTIGKEHQCVCGGTVTIEGTGKGEGKNEQVRYVCSQCGPDKMFACASKSENDHSHHSNKGK